MELQLRQMIFLFTSKPLRNIFKYIVWNSQTGRLSPDREVYSQLLIKYSQI